MSPEGTSMADQNVSLETIQDFLAQKRIAMIGVSRDQKDFSRMLFDEFVRRGYDMVAVNPSVPQIAGQRCFARLRDVDRPVEAVLVMTSPAVTDKVVRECAELGISRVWMYRAAGAGAVSQKAVEFCHENGILVVPGHCPYMFWRDSHVGHRLHGFVMKIVGRYPHRGRAVAA